MANKVIFSQYAIPQEQLVEGGPWTYDSNVGKILKGTAEISYTGAFHEQQLNLRDENSSGVTLPNDIIFLYVCNFGYGRVDISTSTDASTGAADCIVHLYAGDFFASKIKPGGKAIKLFNNLTASTAEDTHIYLAYVTN